MKGLERAVQVLECLVKESDAGAAISEMRRRTGLPLATLHRILASWQALGFVRQDERTRRYHLGLRLMELGMEQWRRLDIRAVAHPVMQQLAEEVGCTIYLTVREGYDGVTIDRVDGPRGLQMFSPIGLRLPLIAGSSKRVLIAHLPDPELEDVLAHVRWERVTERTEVDPARVRLALARIRESGYDFTVGETLAGSAGVSVPIWGGEGRVVAGLMAAGPEWDFRQEHLDAIIAATRRAGEEISRRLGYKSHSASYGSESHEPAQRRLG